MSHIRILFTSVFLLSVTFSWADGLGLKSGVFDPPRMAPDFLLPSSLGSDFTLSSQRGKLVVLGFGFSQCTDVCPVTLANLAKARKQLGDAANEMQVVYVTVDPANDNPQRLNEYLRVFDSSFVGISGTDAQLSKLRDEYGILATKAVAKNGKAGYEVHHSSYVYLIDRSGRLRVLVPFGKSPEDIAHDVKILLNEPAKAKK
ncbi:MAG: SCO family protein [Cellvibrio sp.]